MSDDKQPADDGSPVDRTKGSIKKGAGASTEATGKAIEGTGRAVQATGKTVENTGRAVEATGKAAEQTGKAAKHTGRAVGKGGDNLVQAGGELSSTGVGALAGVPMVVAGGVMSAAGHTTEVAGAATEKSGQAAAKTGETARKSGKKVADKGKRAAQKGKRVGDKGRQMRDDGDQQKKGKPTAKDRAAQAGGKVRDIGKKAQQATRASGGDVSAMASLAVDEIKKTKKRATTVVTLLACALGLVMMVSVFSTSMGVLGSESGGTSKSVDAAGVNGVSPSMVSALEQRTEGTKVPWQLLAAINKTAGYEEDGEGWGGFDMEVVKESEPELEEAIEAGDDEFVIQWLTGRLQLGVDGHAGSDLALDTGADSNGMEFRFINDAEAGSAGPAGAVQAIWMEPLEALPLMGNPERAEQVYLLARSWALGNPINECDLGAQPVGTTTTGTGGWGNPAMGPITSPYGLRFHPVLHVSKLHDGTDIGAAAGDPVYAASSGTAHVVSAVAYGQHFVTIDHGNGIQTQYGHMSAHTVTEGQEVQAGEKIGEVGSEGYSTGPHLHFIVRENGETTDPVPFMKERGIDLGKTPIGQTTGSTDTGTNVTNAGYTNNGTPTTTASTGNNISIVQANIPMRTSNFSGSLQQVVATGPDFVSLNEVSGRTDRQITPSGYSSWRESKSVRGDDGTAVLWRSDRWKQTDTGRVVMVADGPQKWDHDRAATWVTVENDTLGKVSFISLHHMVNPSKYGPNKPRRQELYRKGLEKVAALVTSLSTQGPVFVAGDFNYQSSATAPYGPHAVLGEVGLKSNHQMLGRVKTHVGGGSIDYIFAPDGQAQATKQWTKQVGSDHLALGVDYTVTRTGGTATTLPESWEGTSSAGETVTLDRTQLGYAQQIFQVGRDKGVSDEGIVIALMTVFPESKWRNYASDVYPETIGHEYPKGSVGSDRDSVGLFQQRPQSGWGDPMDLLDPEYAAAAFYGGPDGPNNGSPMGLLDHTGWEQRDKGEVAQDVQASAHPDRYAAWETAARELLGVVSSAAVTSIADECETQQANITDGFTVAALNVLGYGHTEGAERPGWPSGEVRFPGAMAALDTKNVSIAALQEMHAQNQVMFRRDYSDTWGSCEGAQDYVVWRKSEWKEVQCGHVSIPYFHGQHRNQPFVLLEQQGTGQKLWFMGIHNPANVAGPARHWRRESLNIELAAIKAKAAQGYPVFIAGDFNDGRDGKDSAQCVLAPYMTNAFGSPPSGCGRPKGDAPVDHIYSHGVTMAEAVVDADITKRISDHPMVTAVVPGQGAGGNCTPASTNPIASSGSYAPNAVKISDCMYGSFDQYISTIGGYRTSSISGNHETGCALDIMVGNWQTEAGVAGGDQIAKWLQSNAKQMGVQYVIWRQRIWSPSRAGEGWRPMSDRGSPTQNHMDHVHVSVFGPKCVVEV